MNRSDRLRVEPEFRIRHCCLVNFGDYGVSWKSFSGQKQNIKISIKCHICYLCFYQHCFILKHISALIENNQPMLGGKNLTFNRLQKSYVQSSTGLMKCLKVLTAKATVTVNITVLL